MKVSKTLIAGAAMAGLFTGAAVRAHATTVSSSSAGTSIHQMDQAPDTGAKDKNACKGQNGCKGKGGCKAGDNGCKGKNSCKGKGGCATDGSKKM